MLTLPWCGPWAASVCFLCVSSICLSCPVTQQAPPAVSPVGTGAMAQVRPEGMSGQHVALGPPPAPQRVLHPPPLPVAGMQWPLRTGAFNKGEGAAATAGRGGTRDHGGREELAGAPRLGSWESER